MAPKTEKRMLKKLMFATLSCVSGALLHADVTAIGNTRDGYPLIVPQVKELVPAEGTFAFPERFSVEAPAELDLAPLAEMFRQRVKGSEIIRGGEGEEAA